MNDSIIVNALSDLLINLSAGWFGVAIIVPLKITRRKFLPLIVNLSLGILALGIAIILRKLT